MPDSFLGDFFLQPTHSLLCRLFRKGPCLSASALDDSSYDSWPRRPTRWLPSFSMNSEQAFVGRGTTSVDLRLLLSHSSLSCLLMQWKRLQKNSYQKNMKPVEKEAFSRLGVRPLKKPLGPSS